MQSDQLFSFWVLRRPLGTGFTAWPEGGLATVVLLSAKARKLPYLALASTLATFFFIALIQGQSHHSASETALHQSGFL